MKTGHLLYSVVAFLIIAGCKNDASQIQTAQIPTPAAVVQEPPKTLLDKNKETIEIAYDCDKKIHANQSNIIDKIKINKKTVN